MKIRRQSKIIELIKNFEIETQDELVSKLKQQGFNVTQATISRDIKELRLSKISSKNGRTKYSILSNEDSKISSRLIRIFVDGVIEIDYAQNMVVIKTLNGMAMAVAAALDAMKNLEIVGTIAGDDTIFCATKTEQVAINIVKKLKDYIKEQGDE